VVATVRQAFGIGDGNLNGIQSQALKGVEQGFDGRKQHPAIACSLQEHRHRRYNPARFARTGEGQIAHFHYMTAFNDSIEMLGHQLFHRCVQVLFGEQRLRYAVAVTDHSADLAVGGEGGQVRVERTQLCAVGLLENAVNEAFQRSAFRVVLITEVDLDGVTQFSEQGLDARDDTGVVLEFDRGIHPGAF
jgi:hypothetical protein